MFIFINLGTHFYLTVILKKYTMDGDNDSEWETNYVNNLSREIVRECANVGLSITPELVVHYVKLKALDPRNGFLLTKFMSRELTQKFVFSCINDLMQATPVMDCIRMQAYWHAVAPKLDEVKLLYNKHVMEKSEASFEEILHLEENENLLRKIAAFTNIYTNTANGNVALNIKETMNPLKSVLKQKDQEFFFGLSKTGKFEYLKYVARLVSGIRIYQHYYKRGSENIDNAPLLLSNATASIRNDVTNSLAKLSNRIRLLVKELQCIYQVLPHMVRQEIPAGFSEDDFAELRHIHHIMTQHEIYLKALFAHLENIDVAVQKITKNFMDKVEKLKETIGTREAIPTTEVYDQFTGIFDEWSALQTESCYLICVGLIVKNLNLMNKYFLLTRLELSLALTETEPKTSEERGKYRRIITDAEGENVDLVMTTDDITLQFHGFCALTIITTSGALLPAETKVGILKYQNNYYGFSSAEAAETWLANPELNIRRAYEVIRTNPQLVDLLNLYDFLHGLRTKLLVTDNEDNRQTTHDRIVQTVLHPVLCFRDKDYSFSEWQLKYKALQLSRIVKCETKSVQTSNHSHFRASIGIQCEPDKTTGTEPRKDVGCVHESLRHYIWGLRSTNNRVRHLDLTQPIYGICENIKEKQPFRSVRAQRSGVINTVETECECDIPKEKNSHCSNDSW